MPTPVKPVGAGEADPLTVFSRPISLIRGDPLTTQGYG